jgi:hypothetical protein
MAEIYTLANNFVVAGLGVQAVRTCWKCITIALGQFLWVAGVFCDTSKASGFKVTSMGIGCVEAHAIAAHHPAVGLGAYVLYL